MSKIIELKPEVFNRIAAGEVIENPASVVKELVENSLDAKADFIKIIVKGGGRKEITIIDNGIGMSEEDALLSIKKHTTSKISNVDDLQKITTFGFRGEALSSIVSVSIVDIITRQKRDDMAVKLHIENAGKDISVNKIGGNVGTTVKVQNLFYNTPARLKFLKKESAELLKIKNIITPIAISNFNVRFELNIDGESPVIFKRQSTIIDRLGEIFGNSIKEKLLYFETDKNIFKIYGYVGKPDFNKPNRTSQYLFLNKRIIKNKFFSYWLKVAFENLMMKGRHPVAFVFIQASPEFVDVNVHPSKTEVRFLNEHSISSAIINSIRESLSNQKIIPDIAISDSVDEKESFKEEVRNATINFYKNVNLESPPQFRKYEQNNLKSRYEYIEENYFTLFNTYIFVEKNEEVFIIDQHAAHERVIYERLKRELEKKDNIKQNLLIPININLSPEEKTIVEENINLLNELGFEVEDFGNNSYVIRAVPAYIRHSNDKELFLDIVAVLKDEKEVDKKKVFDEVLKTMSCRTAVKAGDYLNKEQKEHLIKTLLEEEGVYNCPHGRPAVIRLTKSELEKWFKRKL